MMLVSLQVQAILLSKIQRLYILCGLGNLYKFYCVFVSGDCIPRLRVQHTSVFRDDLPGDGGQQEKASQPRHLGSGGLLRQAGTHCFHINLDLMRRFSAMVFWMFVLFTDREVPFSIGTPYNGILHTWSRGQHCV